MVLLTLSKKVFAADKDGALAAANLAGKDLVAAVKKCTTAAKDGAVALTKNLLKLACCYCSSWQPMALLQLLKISLSFWKWCCSCCHRCRCYKIHW